ncbi:MAG TPA: phosphoadenylyl-sulfate reductase [Tenuifilaceae bacterium]|nr:phosphoadenylyl-sulfate reductase [Tenuifilaceae bacterium]HPE18981.1 phosphoadenylyl-sulfate reductase [Tenuifilaceae bacterium]HPJ44634.1 phosphoadenylyl-sulfate reductase [Tenuifilaceae bacterium]HPQ33964.1 phosphoadenylyl-sulfate reductase [Tenuifilaceae bacterium]HRX69013.1 phosphoadenylyl-sulfate reductase [Tenuifilaceae bacterium]
MENKEFALELNRRFSNAQPEELLKYFLSSFSRKIALASSFGVEDQVLIDMIVKIDPHTKIFTLDTGRLFYETYDLIERTSNKYKVDIKVFFPSSQEVEEMVNEKGINLFFQSVENRKECCRVRKIEPLKRAFKGLDVWICGLRREQSVTRIDMQPIEWDDANGLIKINPLIDWSEQMVWNYIREHKVPYNPLHDKGFASIGCQPCTRAIEPGEDVRAGRWWWENPDTKECGLHKR